MTIAHEDAHNENVMPNVRATEVEMGGDLVLRTGGAYLRSESRVDGNDSLSVRAPFSDTVAGDKAYAPIATELQEQVTLQGDDSFDFVGTDKIVFFPARTEGALVQKYYAKAGTVAATAPVNFKIYRGESVGDIVPGNLFYEANLPPELWPANGQEFSFTIDEYAVDPYRGKDHLDFIAGSGTIAVYTSTQPFSAKFNASQTVPFTKVDQHTIDEDVILTAGQTRTPHQTVGVDTSGGSVPVNNPLIAGRAYMVNLTDVRHQDFKFVKDAPNGDYYEYLGRDGVLFDGNTSLSLTSNTANALVTPGIDIERAAGGNDISMGAAREFDGSNDGTVAFFTEGVLNTGDKVRLFMDCNKAAPSAVINYFFKTIRKVN